MKKQGKYDVKRIKELRAIGFSLGEIAGQIGCSRSVVQFYCCKSECNTKCIICSKEIYVRKSRNNGYNTCSTACRNRRFSKDKHPKWKGGVRDVKRSRKTCYLRRLKYKLRAVNLLGGKCSLCGYNKCHAALDFHHKNPLEKDGSIKDLIGHKWETIEKELMKCILLCANCHRELHWNKLHS